jgi:hypothetical protein
MREVDFTAAIGMATVAVSSITIIGTASVNVTATGIAIIDSIR